MTTKEPAIVTLQSPLSTEMSSHLQAFPERCVSSGVEIECDSSDNLHSHPETHHQASVETKHKNSSCQQQRQSNPGLISSDEGSKQEISAGQITHSNVCQNNISYVYVCNKSVSLLKPLSGQTVNNHKAESTKDEVQLDVHKMQIQTNTQNFVKETLIVASTHSNKAKSLLLHLKKQGISADNFSSGSRNKEFKESKECEDRIISTVGKKNAESLGKIIIHPASGLLVSKIYCSLSSNYTTTSHNNNNNNNNNKDAQLFLYKCLKCNQIFSSEQYHQTHQPPNSTKKNSFACHICKKSVSVHSELAEHYHKIHKHCKQITCVLCGKMLSTWKSYEKHLFLVHSSKRPHVCKICSKTFKCVNGLRGHLVMHTDDTKFKCDECDETFKYSTGLIRHKRVHTGAPVVKCHICNKTYMKESLKRHLTTHFGEKNVQCSVCGKKFIAKGNLTQHIKRVHYGIKPMYVCEVCGKVTVSIDALKQHMNIHSGQKPFTCHVCGKSFPERRRLDCHLTIHGEKKFKCDMCGYTCNRMDNLNTHIRTHTGEKPYKCLFCDKAFTRLDNLQTHKRQVHNILHSESNMN